MLEDAARSWILAAYDWSVGELRAVAPRGRAIVLPTAELFPATSAEGEALARHLLSLLLRHTGLESCRVRLRVQTSREAPLLSLPMGVVLAEPEPAASFRRGFGASAPDVVSIHPELLSRPAELAAILCHGLGHLALAHASTPPPGGPEAWDYITDLAAVALGCGVFLANAAFQVGWEEGLTWEGLSVRCQGWLSEAELAFALALHCRRAGVSPEEVAPHLRSGPRSHFRRALRDLSAAPSRR